MLGYFVGYGYLFVAILLMRPLYARVLDHMDDEYELDIEEKFFSCFIAIMASLAWPFVALGAMVMWKPRKTRRELKEERDQLRGRINELEKELGIS